MKRLTCTCGYVASAGTAEELLAVVETHIGLAHREQLRDRAGELVAQTHDEEVRLPPVRSHDGRSDEGRGRR